MGRASISGVFRSRIKSFLSEFLKWNLPFLNLETHIVENMGLSQSSIKECQKVQILMRWLITSRLILICIVCKDICVDLQRRKSWADENVNRQALYVSVPCRSLSSLKVAYPIRTLINGSNVSLSNTTITVIFLRTLRYWAKSVDQDPTPHTADSCTSDKEILDLTLG